MVLADQMWTEMLWDLASFIACSLQVLTHDVIRISFYSPFITDSKSWHRCLLSCLSVYQEDEHFRHCYLWLFSLLCCKYSWTRFCVDTRFLLSWVCAREWDVIQNDSPIHLVWGTLWKHVVTVEKVPHSEMAALLRFPYICSNRASVLLWSY